MQGPRLLPAFAPAHGTVTPSATKKRAGRQVRFFRMSGFSRSQMVGFTVQSTIKGSVMAAVAKMKSVEFTFYELRKVVPSDYEVLKQAVFDLLQEPNSGLGQRFDEKTEQLKLVRRQK
jgi:hypothetical protein